jgi:dihydrodipicolinate synthase/N-acetylneuraminate lyase
MTTPPALPIGVGVALITVFGTDGTPDVDATVARAAACGRLGVSSVLVAGTTGQAWRLTAKDRIVLAGAVKDALPGMPVVVGTGDRVAARGLETTAEVAAAGAGDALLVLTPEDMALPDFYRAARERAGEAPLLAYHNPPMSSPGVAAGDVPALGVDGIKDSSGSTNRLAELVELGVPAYVGSPTMLAIAGACGARGAFLAVANVAPALCLAAWHGDMAAQRRLFGVHLRSTADFPSYLERTAPGSV